MEVKSIMRRKRISKKEKNYVSRTIIDHALELIQTEGKFVKIMNQNTSSISVKKGMLEMGLIAPFNKQTDIDYLLDIWCMGSGKVFSVYWSELPAIDIVSFKRDNWMNDPLILG